MVPILQGLGCLDCQLIEQDKRFGQLPEQKRATIQESTLLTDRYTLSYLWVLGVYELIRTLDQRCHADKSIFFGDLLNEQIRDLKHQIERLRIPLAKMEPSRRNPDDSPIAYPAINLDQGISWQVNADVFISRRELSDALLQLVNNIHKHVFLRFGPLASNQIPPSQSEI